MWWVRGLESLVKPWSAWKGLWAQYLPPKVCSFYCLLSYDMTRVKITNGIRLYNLNIMMTKMFVLTQQIIVSIQPSEFNYQSIASIFISIVTRTQCPHWEFVRNKYDRLIYTLYRNHAEGFQKIKCSHYPDHYCCRARVANAYQRSLRTGDNKSLCEDRSDSNVALLEKHNRSLPHAQDIATSQGTKRSEPKRSLKLESCQTKASIRLIHSIVGEWPGWAYVMWQLIRNNYAFFKLQSFWSYQLCKQNKRLYSEYFTLFGKCKNVWTNNKKK